MLTDLFPMVQFKKDTWEIDEFDCASVFLLIGRDKAMVIDAGMGIGDLKRAIRKLTDKPLVVVISHGHVDHTGNARQFEEIWIHPNDAHHPIPQDLERRRDDTRRIATDRRKGYYVGRISAPAWATHRSNGGMWVHVHVYRTTEGMDGVTVVDNGIN